MSGGGGGGKNARSSSGVGSRLMRSILVLRIHAEKIYHVSRPFRHHDRTMHLVSYYLKVSAAIVGC